MRTLAVVIGNNNYFKGAELKNAVNDANAMSESFKKLQYDVISKTNCNIQDYVELLTELEAKIVDYDATIFYFAGHGFQLDGENYLTSIDCQVSNPNKYHCSKTCITLTELLEIFKKNSDKINIVIIDACRKSFDRGGILSFSSIHAPKGTLIAFSTSPNEGAKDFGVEGHSIYTGALLKYIGREWISVEELFKKVRRTVYNLTEGEQTPWEHTSLIGDFYFNTGQLIYSLELPYDESVVKDSSFAGTGDEFSSIVENLKSCNWDRQNPAIQKFLRTPAGNFNNNQLFLIGRNLLQASGYAFAASDFFENLAANLNPYSNNGENHLLNGILYEIYFDSHGTFRKGNLKLHSFEEIMALRKNEFYKESFKFIQKVLEPYRDILHYIPNAESKMIDIDVLATNEKSTDFLGNEVSVQVISKINLGTTEITEQISKYGIRGTNLQSLRDVLSNFLSAPKELIQINNNIELGRIAFKEIEKEEDIW